VLRRPTETSLFRFIGALLVISAVVLAPGRAADAQPAPAWLRTVRETALWSGPSDPAVQFTRLPPGSYLLQQDAPRGGRVAVYYPGDGAGRQPGPAWLATVDAAPSGPPEWVAESDVGRVADAPRRVAYMAPPDVSAPEVAVLDDASGALLYGRAAHTRAAPASTTKIVTAMRTLELAEDLDLRVAITVDGWAMALADGSSVMGLVPGTRLTIRTLLFGLMLPSGNDAAEQLARSLGGSRAEFIAGMNDTVAELGLHDTHFSNPSGLDAPAHYASAYDLAHLARAAMRDPTFRDIVAAPTYAAEGFELRGHNPILGVLPGADGIKTGTTDQAGRVIVGSVERDGQRVYVVAMHSDDLLADCAALFDWAWTAFRWD
jgi:D-alanyl-D-alanine carboxypeptidase